MITLHFDGLYRCLAEDCVEQPTQAELVKSRNSHKSGVMCYGWLINRDGALIARGHGGFVRREEASSNIAEYLALIEGLEAMLDMGCEQESVEIIGDARSVIDQMTGHAGVNSPSTRPLYKRAQQLSRHFPRLLWTWTPRRKNHAADLLTRRAMKQIRSDPQRYRAAIEKVETPSLPRRLRKHLFSLLDLRVFQPAGMLSI
jgi:ribonuclease HI